MGATAGRRAVLAVLTVALLVAACTGDDGGKTSDTGAQSTGEPGIVRLGLAGHVVVDPAVASLASPPEQMVLDLLYDGLMRLDAHGVPQLALASKVTHNATLDAWVFTIPKDATFSDGTALGAADVVASFEHVAKGGDGSLPALALEPIVGFQAFVDGKAPHLAGLTAPSPHAVRIATTGRFSVLPSLLASPELGIVKVDALKGVTSPADMDTLPLSGAWRVTDADADEATLVPRGPATGIKAVELHVYDDEVAAYKAFGDGTVDWASVPPSKFADAVQDYGTDAFAPFQAEVFFGMNLASPTLASVPLRTAISLAINRDEIVDAVYHDLADPLGTVVPDGVRGHDGARCSPCEPDVERATAIVHDAYPKGKVPRISIDYDESPAQTAMAKLIAADLHAVGIPATLHSMTREAYKQFVVSGKQQLFTFGWIGAFDSPDAYLSRLFQSSSNDNLTAFRSVLVDGFLAKARSTTILAAQQASWAKAENTVLKAHVVVPIAQFRTQVVISDRLHGWHTAVDGSVNWAAVTVSD